MIWIPITLFALTLWRCLYLERRLRKWEIAILKAQGKL